MRNFADKSCIETRNTRIFLLNNFFFENGAVCGVGWENIVERDRPQMAIWHMRIACWVPKATNTHTGCVILIALPLQQLLHERASMLRYTWGADKSLARPGRKQATATEDFEFHISYLYSKLEEY
jgi:hypothetical protein